MRNDDESNASEVTKDLTPVDPRALEDFEREMNEQVIPEIKAVVEERRVRAAESRNLQLKYLTTYPSLLRSRS
jgi:hypothetical protein